MYRRHFSWCVAVMVLSGVCAVTTWAAPPPPQGDAGYWDTYSAGLIALREHRLKDAIALLTQADQRTPGDARLLLARGVALTLNGQYEQAEADFALVRLPEKNREPQLWTHAIAAMSNFVRPEDSTQAPRSLQRRNARPMFLGVPGHMVQSGKDYPTDYASCVIYEMALPHRQAVENNQNTQAAHLVESKRKAGRWFSN